MWSMQELINNGSVWGLEGSMGRAAMDAIDCGDAILGPVGHRDYWGNYVPSRYEVRPGTPGSLEYANMMRQGNGLEDWTEVEFDDPERCSEQETY